MPTIPAPPPANTTIEWVVIVLTLLISAVVLGSASIGVHYFRTIAPRAIAEAARQTQAIDNNTTAIQSLTVALDGLKTTTRESVNALEKNVNARLDTLHRDLTGTVRDEKLDRLERAISKKNGEEEAPLSKRSHA